MNAPNVFHEDSVMKRTKHYIEMKILFQVPLSFVLLLLILANGKMGESCAIELVGDVQFSYPIPETQEITDDTGLCNVSGKIAWTDDVRLLVEASDEFPRYIAQRRRGSLMRNLDGSRLPPSGQMNFQGNATEYFEFIFPSDSVVLRLTYETRKVREFMCDTVLPKMPTASIIGCTQEREIGSSCLFFEQTSSRKIFYTICREDSTGAPRWTVIEGEQERTSKAKSLSSEMEANNSSTPEKDVQYYNDPKILCDLSQCNTFPQNIRIVSCSDGINIGSICTLRCKEGYVPAPHLYKSRSTLPIVQDGIPHFWAMCSFRPREDIFPTWRPQVSTNGFRHFRNPDELYLDCMELELVLDLFTEPFPYYLDFLTAREFTTSPYDYQQILTFINENQDDDQNPQQGESREPEMEQDFRKLVTIPDSLLVSLNEEEWRKVLSMISASTCNLTLLRESVIQALFRRPPVMEPGRMSAGDALSELLPEDCFWFVWSEWEPNVDCSKYCLWDRTRIRYKPCGNFIGNGKADVTNCVRCKRQGCGTSSLLG